MVKVPQEIRQTNNQRKQIFLPTLSRNVIKQLHLKKTKSNMISSLLEQDENKEQSTVIIRPSITMNNVDGTENTQKNTNSIYNTPFMRSI